MRILVVIGTRPEAIKMAPVIRALEADPDRFEVRVCLTAQHRELLDQVIAVFEIPVHRDLDLMAPGQTLPQITARALEGVSQVLREEKPGLVLVHGDTTTSFTAALAAYYAGIPAGHVEAGLRTYDKRRPFPEEINRRLAGALCDHHYAPTPLAREHLLSERVPGDRILVTGNTVIDALQLAVAMPYRYDDPFLARAGIDRRLVLVTAHRRESFGAPFESMCKAMRAIVERNPDVELIYPVHPNPNVRKTTRTWLENVERLHLIAPLEYLPFVHLLKRSYLVLTDSGGLQEEAPSLGKPVLVMREVTERPEAIDAGTAKLVGTESDAIVGAVQGLLDDAATYQAMASASNPYGDGHAATRIAVHLSTLAVGT